VAAGKRRAKRRTMKKRKADWVYRGLEYDEVGLATGTQVASYCPRQVAYSLAPGPLGEVSWVLYDSANYRHNIVNANAVSGGITLPNAARPEGRRPVMLAVEGHAFVTPTTWALGSRLFLGMRLVICEQDYTSGGLALPTDYNIMEPVALTGNADIATYANGWGNLRTRFFLQSFDSNDVEWLVHMKWQGRVSLPPHLCLAMFCQSDANSVNCRMTPKFRTLVEED